MKHGTLSAYGRGRCRCDACKSAKRAYTESLYRRKLASGDVPHGITGYRYGCRCETCGAARSSEAAKNLDRDRSRKAQSRALNRAEYNAKARATRAARHARAGKDDIRHGRSGYYVHGCKCQVCAGAAREFSREYQRNRQSATVQTASRHGYRWTGAEMELVVTRTDLTVEELAKMLGRTAFAVKHARVRATHDPKWMKVAGVMDA